MVQRVISLFIVFFTALASARAEELKIEALDDQRSPMPEGYHSPGAPPPPGEEIRKYAIDPSSPPQENFGVVSMHDSQPFFQVLADRVEYRGNSRTDSALWDLGAWYGTKMERLFVESEGVQDLRSGTTESFQLEAFWNHAVTPYWDSQLGVRHDFRPGDGRTFLAAGFQGMSSYSFEVDSTFYLSENADPSFAFEVEHDFLLSQRLILQPRVATEIAFRDVPELNIGAGFSSLEYGLRLRYHLTRKFAPYIGVSAEQSLGQTRDIERRDGRDAKQVFLVAGLRMWF